VDLSTIKVLDSITARVLDMKFTLAGPNHPKTLEARRKAQAALASIQDESEEAANEATEAILAARILAWENVKDGGKDLECTEENALKLIRHPVAKLVVPNALWAALGDRERFFRV
jgi:hypothetical protein